MSRNTLSDQLVDRRCLFTGENKSQATPQVHRVLERLTADQRMSLADIVHTDEFRLAFAPESRRNDVTDMAQLLLPGALSQAQRELEADVLLGLLWCSNCFHLRTPDGLLRPAQIVSSLELSADPAVRPIVHLQKDALGPFLWQFLPQRLDGSVHGLPGLRIRPSRRRLELTVLGTSASIVIPDVGARRLRAAFAFMKALDATEEFPGRWLFKEHPHRMTPAEEDQRTTLGPTAVLGSALFRRHRLLREALWVQSWVNGEYWSVAWPLGPKPQRIGVRLLDPLFGLPGKLEIDRMSDSFVTIDSTGPDWVGRVLLRPESPPTPREDADLFETLGDTKRAAWRAWEELGG